MYASFSISNPMGYINPQSEKNLGKPEFPERKPCNRGIHWEHTGNRISHIPSVFYSLRQIKVGNSSQLPEKSPMSASNLETDFKSGWCTKSPWNLNMYDSLKAIRIPKEFLQSWVWQVRYTPALLCHHFSQILKSLACRCRCSLTWETRISPICSAHL